VGLGDLSQRRRQGQDMLKGSIDFFPSSYTRGQQILHAPPSSAKGPLARKTRMAIQDVQPYSPAEVDPSQTGSVLVGSRMQNSVARCPHMHASVPVQTRYCSSIQGCMRHACSGQNSLQEAAIRRPITRPISKPSRESTKKTSEERALVKLTRLPQLARLWQLCA